MSVFTIPMPSQNDASVIILQQILGSVIQNVMGLPACTTAAGTPCPEGTTFAPMIQAFNTGLLAFGSIILAIMLFVGTMNSAADGQFLGREWNSIWTPVRLIVGLLFIVPLSGGYCVGQYIFLYVILIGVQMGTSLWNSVLNDVFNNFSPPAEPSYIRNYILTMLQENLVLNFVDNQMQMKTANQTETIPVPTGYTLKVGTIPPDFAKAIIGGIDGQPPVRGVDNDAVSCYSLFNSPAAVSACESNLGLILTGATTINTSANWSENGVGVGSSFFWIGSNGKNITTATDILANPTDYGTKEWDGVAADGLIGVSGEYIYTPPVASNIKSTDPQTQAVQMKLASDSATGLQNFQNNCIGSLGGVTVPPVWQSPTGAIAASCAGSTTQGYLLNQIEQTELSDAVGLLANGTYADCSKGSGAAPSCSMNPDGFVYTPSPISYVDATGAQQTYQPPSVTLGGSWWNAAYSYLILDAQFSANLGQLATAIQNLMTAGFAGANITGDLTLTFYYALAEFGPLYNSTTTPDNFNIFPQVDANSASPAVTTTPTLLNTDLFKVNSSTDTTPAYIGFGGQAVGVGPDNITLQLNNINAADLFLPGASNNLAWNRAIQVYNPNAYPNPTYPNTNTEIPCPLSKIQAADPDIVQLYSALQNLPSTYQITLEFLLNNVAANCSTIGGATVTYTSLVDPLENLMYTLQQNGAINANGQDILPVNQAMNSIFSQLLGNAQVSGVAAGETPVGLNSVMQDVYNLGLPYNGDILASQFSMIQQIRSAGIEMIMNVVASMNDVYTQYKLIMAGLQSNLQSDESQASVAAGLSSAGSIPIIGSAFSSAGQILIAETTLDMQVQTLTTMSNIGLQLMWMPVFLFVMTSLFTAGVQFALVVPFMPYMMFWGGQMAWVLGVIEAVVAAPLVMLGLAYPGGNQYLGHAQPAVKMLLAVVFRPVLMVIGIVTAMILTYILISYSAQGFHVIADNTLQALPPNNQTISGVMSCILLFSYCSFLMMAVTKCFSPIYSIPDAVMQYIGAHGSSAGKEEAQQFGQAAEKTAGSAAQAGSQALEQGVKAQQTKGQNQAEIAQKSAQTKFDTWTAGGKGTVDTIKNVAEAAEGGGE